jgi:hypothetical protein
MHPPYHPYLPLRREMQRLMGLRWHHSHIVNFLVNFGVYFVVVLFFWLAGASIKLGQ